MIAQFCDSELLSDSHVIVTCRNLTLARLRLVTADAWKTVTARVRVGSLLGLGYALTCGVAE